MKVTKNYRSKAPFILIKGNLQQENTEERDYLSEFCHLNEVCVS